ncbi:MAG: hypothetical protein QM775_01695 [Pirellulales bacterium]
MSTTPSIVEPLLPPHHYAAGRLHAMPSDLQPSTSAMPPPSHAAVRADVPEFITPETWPGGLPAPDFAAWAASGAPLVAAAGNQSSVYQAAKRALDVAGALVALALLRPSCSWCSSRSA